MQMTTFFKWFFGVYFALVATVIVPSLFTMIFSHGTEAMQILAFDFAIIFLLSYFAVPVFIVGLLIVLIANANWE